MPFLLTLPARCDDDERDLEVRVAHASTKMGSVPPEDVLATFERSADRIVVIVTDAEEIKSETLLHVENTSSTTARFWVARSTLETYTTLLDEHKL